MVSTTGTALIAVAGLLVAVIAVTPLDMRHILGAMAWMAGLMRRGAGASVRGAGASVRALFPERPANDVKAPSPGGDGRGGDDDEPAFVKAKRKKPDKPDKPEKSEKSEKVTAEVDADADADADDAADAAAASAAAGDPADTIIDLRAEMQARGKKKRRKQGPEIEVDLSGGADTEPDVISSVDADAAPVAEADAGDTTRTEAAEVLAMVAAELPAADSSAEPVIIENKFLAKAPPELPVKKPKQDFIRADGAGSWVLPTIEHLDYDPGVRGELDKDAMLELAARLEKTLGDYGVKGRVTEIHPGPVVTMYEFVPVAGTRVSKIANLADDLAMSLAAVRVRIVAPIPGKNAIGVEVPNKLRETVYLKEIIADDAFNKVKSKLTIALGKDIAGRPTAVDLAKMPHLLVAGTTGAGKSVAINSFIVSLLYNATPDDVRLIMIDPKMLELRCYEGIPHLLLPVVTDPKKANLALRWAVEEMERRYELIAASGMRDIASYNKKLEKILADQATRDAAGDSDGTPGESLGGTQTGPNGQLPLLALAEASGEPLKKLPYIVVIIDEFADLMMVASKEVETSVARIAQKARAAGIHLLLATQRPSVDVITGLIKANFPSRIAFQVAQKVDSRTILDQQGAENLLGQGDMLFSDRGAALRRVHGCLVTETEIERVVTSLRAQGKPVYDLDILKPRDDDGEDGDAPPEEDMSDAMYDQAVKLVAETRQASISMVQRRLRVGYNRAARMIERMEREGIVGPADGPNRREVLVQPM
ncbi:MAG: DNA translocase FtsK [Deltaproteobacteria bacterium]|nr:DNA translocase FtsK [Deltaproteobacteria bacterium]